MPRDTDVLAVGVEAAGVANGDESVEPEGTPVRLRRLCTGGVGGVESRGALFAKRKHRFACLGRRGCLWVFVAGYGGEASAREE